jgi:exodeoxyribonuclease III
MKDFFMKLMTWNVNSVRARLDNIIECLNAQRPDIVAFQEIKCIDDAFPAEVFEDMGYNLAIFGQKSYNIR